MFTDPQTSAAIEGAPLKKFLFERSFDAGAAVRAPERKPVTLKPEQYDALKKEAYDAGYEAGQRAQLDEKTTLLAATLSEVGNKVEHLIGALQAMQKKSEHGMRHMVLAIARKLLPDFVARNGLQEIEAMLGAVISEMVHEPRLVVRVHETQFDVLNEKITALASQKAYAGKIVVLADAELAAGDCRVEWADGGMERNNEATWQAVDKTVTPQDDGSAATTNKGSDTGQPQE